MSTLTILTTRAEPSAGQPKHNGCCGNCSGTCTGEGAHTEETSHRVAARAFEIFRMRTDNGTAGDALSDWLQAEHELESHPENPPTALMRATARRH
jgi:hypothetical protein